MTWLNPWAMSSLVLLPLMLTVGCGDDSTSESSNAGNAGQAGFGGEGATGGSTTGGTTAGGAAGQGGSAGGQGGSGTGGSGTGGSSTAGSGNAGAGGTGEPSSAYFMEYSPDFSRWSLKLTDANGNTSDAGLESQGASFNIAHSYTVDASGAKLAVVGKHSGGDTTLRAFPLENGVPKLDAGADLITANSSHSVHLDDLGYAPGGDWIAFASDHANDENVHSGYVLAASGGAPIQVFNEGDVRVAWASSKDLQVATGAVNSNTSGPCYRAAAPDFAPTRLLDSCMQGAVTDQLGRMYVRSPQKEQLWRTTTTGVERVPHTEYADWSADVRCDLMLASPSGDRVLFGCSDLANDKFRLDSLNVSTDELTTLYTVDSSIGFDNGVAQWHAATDTLLLTLDNELRAVPLSGGQAVTVASLPYLGSAGMGLDGVLWLDGKQTASEDRALYRFADPLAPAANPQSLIAYHPAAGASVNAVVVAPR